MKQLFENVLKTSRRKIVVHHCHLIEDIADLLNDNDLVFFDDCLCSQHAFIEKHMQELSDKNINCVLGFSTGLHRNSNVEPNNCICSALLHDRVHSGDMSALNGFMSLTELKQLLKHDNMFLACHGHMHLQLEKICKTKISCAFEFSKDLKTAVSKLKEFNLTTDIFVYPYAFDFFISDKIVSSFGFKHIFAGKNSQRIEIERIKHES